ncbi:hypothetical protein [Rhizobium leguminosarum]|uniref:hypothetical protein n=1 Tax=Rhizobium leguminosarum TaxID=384 RepID=UPI0012F62F48|nr:hypothetical protein [Rhizobium leguminosarum]
MRPQLSISQMSKGIAINPGNGEEPASSANVVLDQLALYDKGKRAFCPSVCFPAPGFDGHSSTIEEIVDHCLKIATTPSKQVAGPLWVLS